MPDFKGIKVVVEKTGEEVTPLSRLVPKYLLPPRTEVEKVPGPEQVFTDVACPFCGCVCDDLVVHVVGNRVVKVERACVLGMSKFLNHYRNRILKPYKRQGDKFIEVPYEKIVDEVAEVLVNSKYPLLFGWSSSSNEALRIGVKLAEALGGVIDNTAVFCHGPTILAEQEVGVVTATLGQIKNRADLIIYWGCNPLAAHLRHGVRYTYLAQGFFIGGRKNRKVVVVDVRETEIAKVADLFIKVKPNKDLELLRALRAVVNELELEVPEVAGVPVEKVYELAELMISARFGVLFFGLGITMTRGKYWNIVEAIRLVQDLNKWTKFVLIPMRGHYNVTGTNAALCWLTGYPYAIEFAKGYPRHIPGLTTSTDILLRGDCDAVLVIASDPAAHMPKRAVESMSKVPLIVIDPKCSLTACMADYIIPSAIVGIECEGTAYRMDHVPIRMRKVVEPPPGIRPDHVILYDIYAKVMEKLRR
ncbi:MAG: formylmethanofuran dehydrogenase subunit B [Thermoprotei archaeon]|nr:MAG: formylmethanofuran dehydrogenase subunit B [Thermoprotei archaeon]